MSEFWQRKMRTCVCRHDFNNDGVLTKEDFELIGNRFAELEQAGSARRKTVKDRFNEVFEIFSKMITKGEKLTEEKFIESVKAQRNDAKFVKLIKDTAYAAFIIIDSNGDGYIQREEYARLLQCIHVDDYETMSTIAFRSLDTNQDGIISTDEFRSAILDFFCGEDENGKGTLVFGPLV